MKKLLSILLCLTMLLSLLSAAFAGEADPAQAETDLSSEMPESPAGDGDTDPPDAPEAPDTLAAPGGPDVPDASEIPETQELPEEGSGPDAPLPEDPPEDGEAEDLSPAARDRAAVIASGTCGSALTWTLDAAGLLTISGSGIMKTFMSPQDVPWYGVRESIKTIQLSPEQTSIGYNSFNSCIGLTEVVIPESVTLIDGAAFCKCSALRSVTIPASVTAIKNYVFEDCSSLRDIWYGGTSQQWSEISIGTDNQLDDVEIHCTNGDIEQPPVASGSCGPYLFWALDGEGTLTISGGGWMYNYEYRQSPWFSYQSQLKAVVIEEGMTELGANAFSCCTSLESVTLPTTLTVIGAQAFQGCTALTAIALPASLRELELQAFCQCTALTEITIPDGVTSIPNCAFLDCGSLTRAVLPAGITAIGEGVFMNCTALTDVQIPACAASIGENAFYGTALSSLEIPYGMSSLPEGVFMHCAQLYTVTLPSSLTQIDRYAFYGCSKLSSVLFVGSEAQWNSIEIGANNEPLINAPLYTSGHTILNAGRAGASLSWTLDAEGTLTLSGSGATYDFSEAQRAPWYEDRAAIRSVVLKEGLSAVGTSAFADLTNLERAELPHSLKSVGENAFLACASLTEAPFKGTPAEWAAVTVAAGNECLTGAVFCTERPIVASGVCGVHTTWSLDDAGKLTIGGYGDMFSYYDYQNDLGDFAPWYSLRESITSVVVKREVSRIGRSAFWDCGNIVSVSLPADLGIIEAYAFKGCGSLAQIELPDDLRILGNAAFRGCTALREIAVPESVGNLGQYVFDGCSGLREATVASHEIIFPEGLFRNCGALRTVSIPRTVQHISIYCFQNCTSLSHVYYGGTSTKWAEVISSTFSTLYSESNNPLRRALVHYAILEDESSSEGLVYTKSSGYLYVSGYTGKSANVYIPASVKETSGQMTITRNVVLIDERVFKGKGVMKVSTSSPLATIREEAFSGCYNLQTFVCSSSLTTIGEKAFYYCGDLSRIRLPASVSTIGPQAFAGCGSLKTAGPGELEMGNFRFNYAFGWTTSIPANAFSGTGLTNIVLPDSLVTIGNNAFLDCGALESITLPDSLGLIMGSAFENCESLSEITLPGGVMMIGEAAFKNCSALESVSLPEEISMIHASTFAGCTGLKSVTIPVGVSDIGANAFADCGALQDVYFAGTRRQWREINVSEEGNEALRGAVLHCEETPILLLADLDADGDVDAEDLYLLAAVVKSRGEGAAELSGDLGDLNEDGVLNGADLVMLSGYLKAAHIA